MISIVAALMEGRKKQREDHFPVLSQALCGTGFVIHPSS